MVSDKPVQISEPLDKLIVCECSFSHEIGLFCTSIFIHYSHINVDFTFNFR